MALTLGQLGNVGLIVAIVMLYIMLVRQNSDISQSKQDLAFQYDKTTKTLNKDIEYLKSKFAKLDAQQRESINKVRQEYEGDISKLTSALSAAETGVDSKIQTVQESISSLTAELEEKLSAHNDGKHDELDKLVASSKDQYDTLINSLKDLEEKLEELKTKNNAAHKALSKSISTSPKDSQQSSSEESDLIPHDTDETETTKDFYSTDDSNEDRPKEESNEKQTEPLENEEAGDNAVIGIEVAGHKKPEEEHGDESELEEVTQDSNDEDLQHDPDVDAEHLADDKSDAVQHDPDVDAEHLASDDKQGDETLKHADPYAVDDVTEGHDASDGTSDDEGHDASDDTSDEGVSELNFEKKTESRGNIKANFN